MGSDRRPDPNPIIDEGAPTSTGGMRNGAALCDQMDIAFQVDKPRASYLHGWGDKCADAKTIGFSWSTTIMGANNWPETLTLDLVDGESPLILGMDVRQYSDTCNQMYPSTIAFKRPHDKRVYTLYTYIANDETGNKRLRLGIVAHGQSTVSSLMANTQPRSELLTVKRLHRFGHGTAHEVREFLKDANLDQDKVSEACDKVYAACPICAATGIPAFRKKVSLSHVNEAFYEEIQVEFLYASINGTKRIILNIVDVGTRYGERILSPSRDTEQIRIALAKSWIYRHGSPRKLSANHEFCRTSLSKYLRTHNIQLEPRPSRSSSKSGNVERKTAYTKRYSSEYRWQTKMRNQKRSLRARHS